jgi:HK97 family phage prohead protease/HK97 family phage major capsid protein
MRLKNKFNTKVVSEIKTVKAAEDGGLIIEGYANTVTKDRAGDIIPKTAWETQSAMTNYLKNPIILAFHDHEKPIGKMVDFEVTDLGLKIKAHISTGAGHVYDLIKDGTLSAFSVGFNILDADYDSKSDTYFINDVELHEVSVVSVPCNQDSTFSVAKSMESSDFERFKTNITPKKVGDNKENQMTLEEIQKMTEDAIKANAASSALAAAEAATKAVEAAEAKKIAAAKAIDDKKAQAEALDASIKANATLAAKVLIDDLEKKLNEKEGAFADLVKANNDQIISLKEEIAQVVASRNKPFNAITTAMRGIDTSDEKAVDELVMLATIKGMDVFATDAGKAHFATKAVNPSSSIVVSSDSYETTFSTNLIRDIQAKLVIAPLFTEMAMNSANLTIPINPNRSNANWVAAAVLDVGSNPARTGAEITVALTEKTLKTFKLAAKTYLTEETEEDAILSLIPILRSHLVEAHAAEMDNAFLNGSGTGEPKGLITQALAVAAGAQKFETAAIASGSVKVTALGIAEARRKLDLYGLDLNNISLVVSQDAYWDLILDPEWGDVQQVNGSATKLVGEVGNIYGMKVLVSNAFPAKANDATYAIMVNTSNFVTTRQRGLTLRSDFEIELDRTVFVATQRVNLEPLIDDGSGNGKGVVAITYDADGS